MTPPLPLGHPGEEGKEKSQGSRFGVGPPQGFCFKSYDLGFC